jgi:predicted ATPase
MKLKELHIQNYKSLVDLKIIEPNPFTVFAGSNGAGKSNIFEALEFFSYSHNTDFTNSNNLGLFGGLNSIYSFKNTKYSPMLFNIDFNDSFPHELTIKISNFENQIKFSGATMKLFSKPILESIRHDDFRNGDVKELWENALNNPSFNQFFNNFTRLFIGNSKILRQNIFDDLKLNADCSNLEKVLKRVLKDKNKREEISEWLDLLIPGFDNIEIVSEPLSGTDSLIIYEKGTKKPYTKNLLSDGTYNILALLTSVYQSDEPQFLCIEEPENGLNPKVQIELVNLFRQKCEENGHYIWINTHSQTIVNQLSTEELILVDKVEGATQIKQLTNFDTHGLPMDEAWLSNSLGGGIPW